MTEPTPSTQYHHDRIVTAAEIAEARALAKHARRLIEELGARLDDMTARLMLADEAAGEREPVVNYWGPGASGCDDRYVPDVPGRDYPPPPERALQRLTEADRD